MGIVWRIASTGETSAPGSPPAHADGLAAAARGGDRNALEQLLRVHYDRMHAVCLRILDNPADAADATQDAMIAVVRGLPRFDARSSFSTWAYRIAFNCSIDLMRRRDRGRVSSIDEVGEAATLRPGDDNPDDRLAVDSALRQVPLEFRGPVVLRDLCGLDYAEIADVLGIPAGTVRSRISRGRALLASILRPVETDQ